MRLNPVITRIPRAHLYGSVILAAIIVILFSNDLAVVRGSAGGWIRLHIMAFYYPKHSIDHVSELEVLRAGGLSLFSSLIWWNVTVVVVRREKRLWGRVLSVCLCVSLRAVLVLHHDAWRLRIGACGPLPPFFRAGFMTGSSVQWYACENWRNRTWEHWTVRKKPHHCGGWQLCRPSYPSSQGL